MMPIVRRILFYAFVLIYIIGCPIIILDSLGIVFFPEQKKIIQSTGLVSLATIPEGASVFINSNPHNRKTPAVIRDLPEGEYSMNSSLEKLNKDRAYGFKQRLSFIIHKKELRHLQNRKILPPLSKDIYHLVIFPLAKEPVDVIRPGLEALLTQSFPCRQMMVVYAVEERVPEETKKALDELIKEHKGKFFELLMIIHPDNLPGEARVKGANASSA